MIVFINPSTNFATIYFEDKKPYTTNNVDDLKKLINNEKVLYVTEAIEAGAEEVINLYNNLLNNYQSESFQSYTQNKQYGDDLFLQYTGKGSIGINYKNDFYMFENKYDLKLIKDLPKNILVDCYEIKNGIANGVFSIVDEQEREEILQEKQQQDMKKSSVLVASNISAKDLASGKHRSAEGSAEEIFIEE